MSLQGQVFNALMGPLFNLFWATLVFLFVRRKYTPYLFPLLLWAGTAYLQEAGGIFVGLVGGPLEDWGFLVQAGLPVPAAIAIGVVLLGMGTLLILWTMPLAGVYPDYGLKRMLVINVLGFLPIFVVSFLYESLAQTGALQKRGIALVAAGILVLLLTVIARPVHKAMSKLLERREAQVPGAAVGVALGLCLAIITGELLFF